MHGDTMMEKEDIGKVLEYIASIDTNSIQMTMCELIDEKSNVWNFEKHSHDFLELLYFLDGKGTVNVMDKPIKLSLFELVVYPHRVMHQESLDMHYHQEVICINLECKCDLMLQNSFKIKDIFGEFEWVFKKLYCEYKTNEYFKDEILNEYIKILLILIKRYIQENRSEKADSFEKCVRYIHDHFAEKLSVKKIAQISFVSPSYLSRVFKKRLGLTPMHYLNIYRIEVAKKMLILTDYSIQEIAEFVGIEDLKHFFKVFKRIANLTPLKYRKENSKKLEVG
jgi:AraC-like DNA-binding protein